MAKITNGAWRTGGCRHSSADSGCVPDPNSGEQRLTAGRPAEGARGRRHWNANNASDDDNHGCDAGDGRNVVPQSFTHFSHGARQSGSSNSFTLRAGRIRFGFSFAKPQRFLVALSADTAGNFCHRQQQPAHARSDTFGTSARRKAVGLLGANGAN
ncbi:esterase [Anopheles sinensis]|uniref:Esterase n=1 Tax=Anopheles sinensis TaxID=74873 RepID=A0A084WAL0_ANOSI|nr:esterase [Anopheles sinensis]